ncbi:MAG: heavy-metal-associated domain-containing protein [Dehalococcoidia bacterium]|nr:heavy-metal-associated domain-containing protein [Dehalococcoidia bacterium]
MQLTLTAPDITCEHCIATIERTVNAIEGARFLQGSELTQTFTVEVASGGILDAVGAALAAEGYPLGEASATAPPAAAGASAPAIDEATWTPAYRVTRTEVGADVNYACPCSCDAGFALDRSQAEQDPESCCCGRQILVGHDAESRLRSALEQPGAYRYDHQSLTMPWGQPLEVALAIPLGGAEHGSHDPASH